jgi:hypothetical protein
LLVPVWPPEAAPPLPVPVWPPEAAPPLPVPVWPPEAAPPLPVPVWPPVFPVVLGGAEFDEQAEATSVAEMRMVKRGPFRSMKISF